MKKSYKNKDRYKHPRQSEEILAVNKSVVLPSVITVKELSEKTNLPVVSIISELMKNGILAAINESIDYDTAAIVCDDLGVKCEISDEDPVQKDQKNEELASDDRKSLVLRPPVVTVMGHVDHGKTTLLDNIRLANVVNTESGGITQHISAYQLSLSKKRKSNTKIDTITFIDTPGHAAFSALRQHGTVITDIVILIVAADDGVMPQTIEVIEQCQKNNVPMIVAINKVDLPDADVMRVKQQLSEYGLAPEEWGGKTMMAEISAKTSLGIEDLLEMVLLQAEMMELKADPKQRAFGVVIESHMHKGAGPLALVLIENGTLKKGDVVVVGQTWGRVRILQDYNQNDIETAGPSMPVRIAGLKDMPSFGDHLASFEDEKEAREAASKTSKRSSIKMATAKKLTDEGEDKKIISERELKIVLKTDVKGSLEAVKKLLGDIDSLELSIKIVGEGIGSISESDTTLAKATSAIVYAFRVPVLVSAKKISEKEKVSIRSFDIIYELIDDIKSKLTSMLPTIYEEEVMSRGKVLAMFRNDKKTCVVGALLDDGRVTTGEKIRFTKGGEIVYEGNVVSLRREKDQVNEIVSGVEFGLGLEPGAKVDEGMNFVSYKENEVIRAIK